MDTLKRYVITAGVLLTLTGLGFGLRWVYQRVEVGVAAYVWLASAPVDAAGKPIGNTNRAVLIDALLAHPSSPTK